MAAPAGPVLINMDPGTEAVPANGDAAATGGSAVRAPHARANGAGHELAPLAAALRTARRPVVLLGDAAGLASELTAALSRDGPTVIDASIDPTTYPAVMDLTRGEAGRHPPVGQRLGGAFPPPTGHDPSTGT